MATVHFAPQEAIKYTGKKAMEFTYSLARPKPVLKQGDIVIVDKRTAQILTRSSLYAFESVDEISFNKSDVASAQKIESLEEELSEVTKQRDDVQSKLEDLEESLKTQMSSDEAKNNSDSTDGEDKETIIEPTDENNDTSNDGDNIDDKSDSTDGESK
jgi:hypothetical protein